VAGHKVLVGGAEWKHLFLLGELDRIRQEQLEAAEMDGAPVLKRFFYIILPHLSRAITIVLLIQTIFLLAIFAEIFMTTGGAFGTRTLSYLIFQRAAELRRHGASGGSRGATARGGRKGQARLDGARGV